MIKKMIKDIQKKTEKDIVTRNITSFLQGKQMYSNSFLS